MEFTSKSIHEAHKLYTGPDFPKLIKEFRLMGMITNSYNLETGIVSYVNETGECIEEKGIEVEFTIEENSFYDKALDALKRNQEGVSDFPTFCIEIARAGIYKWVSDLEKMTCSYYDKKETILISEDIPTLLV